MSNEMNINMAHNIQDEKHVFSEKSKKVFTEDSVEDIYLKKILAIGQLQNVTSSFNLTLSLHSSTKAWAAKMKSVLLTNVILNLTEIDQS